VSKAKTPITRHGHLEATTDSEQIRRWWQAHPAANIGARCTWFFVVDIDPRNGGHHVLDGWRSVRGDFPRTWRARTGSGGLHVFFRHSPELDTIPLGRLYSGVDIKGGGRGYVLLAPSQSRSGTYSWLVSPSEAELAPAPRWLVREIVITKTPKTEPPPVASFAGPVNDRVDRARRYARRLPGAVSGAGGHDTTFRACMLVARGFALSEAEAFPILAEWNQACVPPWSERDLRRKVREALSRGTMPMGALLVRGAA
jgi:hypothetical protein